MLYDIARPHMTLRLNSRVVGLDASAPSVTLSTGEIVRGDVIIGADGVKSTLREYVVGKPDKPTPTGDAAYRAIIPAQELMKHEDLRPLVETPEMVGWMGPGRHIMAYCIVSVCLYYHYCITCFSECGCGY
jgi:salicylate hydroxylase